MALFGRDHDRDLGDRGGLWNRGYDRMHGFSRDQPEPRERYLGMYRYEPDMGANRYDRDRETPGYDRDNRSRWQTNFGDPFGDRAARTPMRVIRGGYRTGYDQGYRGGDRSDVRYGRDRSYDRDFRRADPTGYDPYASRGETGPRGNERSRWTYGRGYDTGWFW